MKRTFNISRIYLYCLGLLLVCGPAYSYSSNVHFQIEKYLSLQNMGLIPIKGSTYQLNHSSFSDYASKIRTVYIPDGLEPVLSDDEIIYPDGTVFTKTFYYLASDQSGCKKLGDRVSVNYLDERQSKSKQVSRKCFIETRVIVKQNGIWVPYVYRIQNNQFVSAPLGETVSLLLQSKTQPNLTFNYHIPDLNTCKQCHSAQVDYQNQFKPIGPRFTWRLTNTTPWLPQKRSHSKAVAVTSQARLYLDINCGYCHAADGQAASSNLNLMATTQQGYKLGVCKPVVAPSHNSELQFDIDPGSPSSSVIISRMNSKNASWKMPEVGVFLTDSYGLNLVSQWIKEMNNGCEG